MSNAVLRHPAREDGLDRPRHFILSPLGSDGDVLPYLGLGATLRRRGHGATLVAAEDYQPRAEALGMDFRPLLTKEENWQLFSGNPDFWHPLKGATIGAKWGRARIPAHFELFRELARDERAVFVTSPALVAARVVQELTGRPLATPILQPWMIASSSAPPVMPAGLTLPQWAPKPAAAAYWLAIDGVGYLLTGRALNELRRSQGLAPVRRLFRWWHSPQLVLGMFPPWYGPPQQDWAPQIRLTGFPRFDGATGQAALDEDLLAWCHSGKPVVAFTFGTAMAHAGPQFRAGVEACELLGVRGLLVARHADQLPNPLPPIVRHVGYAPFRELFPHCAAVVHHGGIGTIAEAFAAGVPQVVLPIAFDQKDNAIRVKRLGTGDWVRAARATGQRLAALLKGVLSEDVKRRCREVAGRFGRDEPLEVAATALEELAASVDAALSGSPPRHSKPASPTAP
jgi:UDP:flavonoid glycosyltransferase YjiC (YdhE family)